MKYFLHLGYKGTNYRGWQRQPGVPTIQKEIETQLSRMLGAKINLIGCGRTDAEVHALQYFAHFKWNEPIEFDPVFRLNKMLPDDIAIHDIIEAPPKAHAQHDALSKTYQYFIHLKKDPFLADWSTLYQLDLNLEMMQEAVELLRGEHDFHSFCKAPAIYKTTLCNLHEATFEHFENRMSLTLRADRFLQNMVRIIVGRLLDLGQQKISMNTFKKALFEKEDFPYKNPAYPQGLMLTKVVYPYINLEPSTSLFNQHSVIVKHH